MQVLVQLLVLKLKQVQVLVLQQVLLSGGGKEEVSLIYIVPLRQALMSGLLRVRRPES